MHSSPGQRYMRSTLPTCGVHAGSPVAPRCHPGPSKCLQSISPARRRGLILAASLEGQQVSSSAEAAAGDRDPRSTTAQPPQAHALTIQLDGGATEPRAIRCESGNGGLLDAAPGATASFDDSWQQWQSLFEEVDRAAEEQASLKIELQLAIKEESYSRAAAVQAQLQRLAAADAVLQLQSRLSRALEEERYSEAAELRDGGLAWMQGWWLGRGDDDPHGHLLHVRAEYGRWTGRVFKPDDIAGAKGWKESSLLRLERRHSGFEEALGLPPRPTGGDAVLELFLRQDASGVLSHQAVSFVSASKLTDSAPVAPWRAVADGSSGTVLPVVPPRAAVPLGEDGMVRLSVSLGPDGSACISALPSDQMDNSGGGGDVAGRTGPALSRFDTLELEEAAATAQELRSSAPSTPPPSPSSSEQSDYDEFLEAVASASSGGWDMAGPSPSSGSSSSSSVPGLGGAANRSGGFASTSRSVMFRFSDSKDSGIRTDSSSAGGTETDDGMRRVASELEVLGREEFVLRVPDDETARQRRLLRRRATMAGEASSSSGSGSSSRVPRATSGGADEAVTGRRVQVEIPVGRLTKSDSKRGGTSSSGDLWDEVADRVVGLQESQMGRSVISRKRLAEAIRSIAQKLVAGEVVNDVITLSGTGRQDGPGSIGGMAAVRQLERLRGREAGPGSVEIGYTRVSDAATSSPRTDTFSGLYLGAFGPHGPELLTLTRGTLEGEEAVLAHKLTGDENVPSGALSFQAKIGRKYRLDPRDVYPDDLGIVARYKGEGRIASRGHRNAKSVDGELLVFSGATQLTGSAQLGFVWAVPGERRFLILLNRVDLRDFERTPVGPRKPCVSLLE